MSTVEETGLMPLIPAQLGSRNMPVVEGLRLAPRHRILLLVADACALFGGTALAAAVLQAASPARAGDTSAAHIAVTVAALWLALHLHGLYRRPAARLRPSGWWRPSKVAKCLPAAALMALAATAALFNERMTLTAAVVMTLPAVVLVPLGRRLLVAAFGPPTVTRLLVVGGGTVTDRLTARLNRCPDTQVVARADVGVSDRPLLGDVREIAELCHAHRVDRVLVAFSDTPDRKILEALRCLEGRVPISVVPRFFEIQSWRSEIEELHGLPLMHVPEPSLGGGERAAKRLLDLGVALLTILITSPFWIAAAVAIKLDSPGPVFFRQLRAGRQGEPFSIVKFRTMADTAVESRKDLADQNENDGPLFKMRNDPRVTRVGAFLRRTSLDELPQLLNVLRGEMSLVGPRPLPMAEAAALDGAALTRMEVAPGITGLWQVSGRSDLSYADLQHLDSVYVRSWSLRWDLRILAATPRSVLSRSGAY